MAENPDDLKMSAEVRIYHNVAIVMASILITIMGWIGANVSQIPAINQQIHDMKEMIENVVERQVADHEARIRVLEGRK